MKKDLRYKQIGGKHRASTRYEVIKQRLATTDRPRNKGYKGVELRISKEAFVEWFMKNDFEGCTVDRDDNKGHYEEGNLKLIPGPLNNRKDRYIGVAGFNRCYACRKVKPMEEFVNDKRRHNGKSTICILCERARNRERMRK